jgi:superkiller protein 8
LANICFTAHIFDIFSLAITDKQILSVSGASSIKAILARPGLNFTIKSCGDCTGAIPIDRDMMAANGPAGCNGPNKSTADLTGADAWAIAISEDGQYLAGVTQEIYSCRI